MATLPVNPAVDSLNEAQRVIEIQAAALERLALSLDGRFHEAAARIAACQGRIVIAGVGKSGYAARKIAGTLSSLGTPALFLHGTEALHGDLGKMIKGDTLIALSVSGETNEICQVAQHAQASGIYVMAITAHESSRLGANCDLLLPLPATPEGCAFDIAPMASMAMIVALGDALATVVSQLKQFSRNDMALLHPGGAIGHRLRPIRRLMHAGDRMPLVSIDASSDTVIAEINAKGFGVTGVVDAAGRLVGIITDGDLRRHLAGITEMRADAIMTDHPVTLRAEDDAEAATTIMRTHRITVLFVTDPATGQPIGLVHIHDLLRSGIL